MNTCPRCKSEDLCEFNRYRLCAGVVNKIKLFVCQIPLMYLIPNIFPKTEKYTWSKVCIEYPPCHFKTREFTSESEFTKYCKDNGLDK